MISLLYLFIIIMYQYKWLVVVSLVTTSCICFEVFWEMLIFSIFEHIDSSSLFLYIGYVEVKMYSCDL